MRFGRLRVHQFAGYFDLEIAGDRRILLRNNRDCFAKLFFEQRLCGAKLGSVASAAAPLNRH